MTLTIKEQTTRGFLSDHDGKVPSTDDAAAVDGIEKEVELNDRPLCGKLGAPIRQVNDGPRPYIQHSALSDKSAWDWVAMRRAQSGSLMRGAIENKSAEIALRRGRALYDAANADISALPPIYTRPVEGDEPVYSDDKAAFRMDLSVSDLNTDAVEPQDIPFQMDYRVRFGPPKAPRERKLASLTEDQYKRLLKRMPSLHEERRDVPRGPTEDRPPKEWRDASLRWAGKVKCKGGAIPFNPLIDQAPQQARLEAVLDLELLKGLMDEEHYNDFIMILPNSVPMQLVGEQAGFTGKQAEAVGLDRCRSAIAIAIGAFESIDIMNGEEGWDWLNMLPEATRIPVWLVQSPHTRERRKEQRRKKAKEATQVQVPRRKPVNV